MNLYWSQGQLEDYGEREKSTTTTTTTPGTTTMTTTRGNTARHSQNMYVLSPCKTPMYQSNMPTIRRITPQPPIFSPNAPYNPYAKKP